MYKSIVHRSISIIILAAFLLASVYPSCAQTSSVWMDLPKPGAMVNLSPAYVPAILKGIKFDRKEPLRFNFVLDTGNASFSQNDLEKETTKLVRYFLASLTVPEKDLWVNLSPYEGDRIIPDDFSLTEMGRDLLSEDYILKQLTSTIMYPESDKGRDFWKRVYAAAADKYGTTDIPIDTFNKVWIMPDEATVYVNGDMAFIASSHLKVMLDADYLLMKESLAEASGQGAGPLAEVRSLAQQVVRDVVLPEIEKEVNTGRNFAGLRQIYHAMILSTWFKRNLKRSVVGQVYADQNKVAGIDFADKQDRGRIWAQYVEAFKKGVFNYIKEERDETTQELIPRKYFSGGFQYDEAMVSEKPVDKKGMVDAAGAGLVGAMMDVVVNLNSVVRGPGEDVSGRQTSNDQGGGVDRAQAGLILPEVTDEELLSFSGRVNDRDVRPRIISLGRSRPELIPQIMALLVNSPSASEEVWLASDLGSIRDFSPGSLPLMAVALAALSLKGNGSASGYLKNSIKDGDLTSNDVSALIQAVESGNNHALLALGIMMINNPGLVATRLNEGMFTFMIDLLTESGLKGKKGVEVEVLDAIIMYAKYLKFDRMVPQSAFLSIEKLARNGSAQALKSYMENLSTFTDSSRLAQMIGSANGARSAVEAQFRRSVVDNPDGQDKSRQFEYFRKVLDRMIFRMAAESEKDGSDWVRALEDFELWENLNIVRPLLWPQEIKDHLIQNRMARRDKRSLPSSSKGIAVAIYPKSDYNRAFENLVPLLALINAGYAVLYYEVSTPNEMVKAIEDATNAGQEPASFALISGHGNPGSTQFGLREENDSFLYADDGVLAQGSLGRFFKSDAKGLVHSCSSGSCSSTQVSMVTAVSDAMGIEISGPVEKSRLVSMVPGESYEFINDKRGQEKKNVQVVGKYAFRNQDAAQKRAGFDEGAFNKGGIDFNSANFRLQEAGGTIDFNGQADTALLLKQVDGFIPVIFSITPMANAQAFFGSAVNQGAS
ncbi:MAG: hypothetical protein V2A70_04135 [Candidatus Omnitrophota bacterium]